MKTNNTNIELTFDFQCWRFDVEKICDIEGYNIELLYKCFNSGLTPEQFYFGYVYLPF